MDIITIDGPSGVGKSSVARALAERLGYRILDTGAMYRAVTLAALEQGVDLGPPVDEAGLAELLDTNPIAFGDCGEILLNGEPVEPRIRSQRVTTTVSIIAAVQIVRARMVELQRSFAELGGVVAEGRDLGSIVFPEAPFKFFLDADPQERADRRSRQNESDPERSRADRSTVQEEQALRDRMDSQRPISPLKLGEDMIRIDTTRLTLEEVVSAIWSIVQRNKT